MDSSKLASRSRARRLQARWRLASGAITESTPTSVTPRKMNGITVVGKSIPWAKPQAATTPP